MARARGETRDLRAYKIVVHLNHQDSHEHLLKHDALRADIRSERRVREGHGTKQGTEMGIP